MRKGFQGRDERKCKVMSEIVEGRKEGLRRENGKKERGVKVWRAVCKKKMGGRRRQGKRMIFKK